MRYQARDEHRAIHRSAWKVNSTKLACSRLFIEGSSPKARVLKGQGYVPGTFPLRARSLPSLLYTNLREPAFFCELLRPNGVLRSSYSLGPTHTSAKEAHLMVQGYYPFISPPRCLCSPFSSARSAF